MKEREIMRILKISKLRTFLVGIMMMTILLCCSSQVQAAQLLHDVLPPQLPHDGDYTYTVTNDQAQIAGYIGLVDGGVVTIPSTIGGFPVTSIGPYAFFSDSSAIRGPASIIIPQGVTGIGDYAFYGCSGLTSIIIPQGVTSIGVEAFSDCTSLTNITVAVDNSNHESIDGVLYNKAGTSLIACPGGLTKISIPQGVTSIGDYAFYSCPGLTSINIPNSVTSIGVGAFTYCLGLTSIIIPQGVTSIGDTAFAQCRDLTSISVPQGVTGIGDYAFQSCSGLSSISIPQGVTSIGDNAFQFCSGLTSITFNSAATTIYDDASTIPVTTTIIGYAPSTAKDYATKYNRMFQVIGAAPKTLQSIAITTPANNLSYNIGDSLDITGLVVTGTYSDGSTQPQSITTANVTGFNSTAVAANQVLSITVNGMTATYKVQIVAAPPAFSSPSVIIYQDANGNYVSCNYLNALSNASMKKTLISDLSATELANLPIFVIAANGSVINYEAAIGKGESYAVALNDSSLNKAIAPVPTKQMNADGTVSSVQVGFTFVTAVDSLSGNTVVNVTVTAPNMTGVTVKDVAATYTASLGAWRAILTGSVTVSASDITLTTAATT